MPENAETFGQMLARYRKGAGLSQRDIASPRHELSYSLIAMLESGRRGAREVILRREQVWYLITRIKLWPPECDRLLEAAGHATDRTAAEEQDIQRHYSFQELWVFARTILDPDDSWYSVVKANLGRGAVYRYFTETPTVFHNLASRLKRDGVRPAILKSQLECTILPRELFVTNFAIYKRGDGDDIYCCGSKPASGRGEAFYTMHISEAHRLYEQLHEWRGVINLQRPIPLSPARRIHPHPERVARFAT